MEKSISQLLRETADRLDAIGSPVSVQSPSSGSPNPSPITVPRDPVDAEVARLFLPYQRQSTPRQRPRPINRGPGGSWRRPIHVTYFHLFCCLSSKSASVTPNRFEKGELSDAGLGEKRISFNGLESCSKYFSQRLLESYPRLSEGGGFELLRARGPTRSRDLVVLDCPQTGYTVTFLRSPEAMIGHATIYIRPMQRSLILDDPEPLPSNSNGPLIPCVSCGQEFTFSLIKSHSDTCRGLEVVAAAMQSGTSASQVLPGTSSAGQVLPGASYAGQVLPGTSSVGQVQPGTSSVDQEQPGTSSTGQVQPGTSSTGQVQPGTSSTDWKRGSDSLEAIKIFRNSVVKESGEALHFSMDLRHSIEEREKSIIGFYKRQRIDWTAPFTCTLGGDAAIGVGVTRHCLSTIMSKLQFGFNLNIGSGRTVLFEGAKDHLVSASSQVLIDSDLFLVAGRIIGHSFLHGGPSLSGLSEAIVHVLAGGMPEMASINTQDCCDTDVREAVEPLRGSTVLTEDQKRSIQTLAISWDLPGVTQDNRRWLMEKILFHAVIFRSHKQVKQMRKGLKETKVLDLISERPDTIPFLFPRTSELLLSPELILDRIIWPLEANSDDDDDDDDDEISLEDKCSVSGFLRTYIENASSGCLQRLLKFWHGWEVPPQQLIVKIVKGSMPVSSTCIETLKLPSHIQVYSMFCDTLDTSIGSVDSGFGRV